MVCSLVGLFVGCWFNGMGRSVGCLVGSLVVWWVGWFVGCWLKPNNPKQKNGGMFLFLIP